MVAAAFLFNKWSIERLLVADQQIERLLPNLAVFGFGACLVLLGVLVWRAGWSGPRLFRYLLEGVFAATAVAGAWGSWVALTTPRQETERELLARVDRAEELYFALKSEIKKTLTKSVLNLRLPDHYSRHLFSPSVKIVDLGPLGPAQPLAGGLVLRHDFAVETGSRTVDPEDLVLWRTLLERVDWFEHASLFIHRGRFTDPSERVYEAEVGFHTLARLSDGSDAQFDGRSLVTFVREGLERVPEPGKQTWRIQRWRTVEMRSLERAGLLFSECLPSLLPDPEALARARRSIHEDYVRAFFLDEDFQKPHEHFTLQSYDRHPGVSVVDIDQDGLDDLYVMARWGKNQLLRNRGDGTFEECAARFGLDLEGHCSSAVFADFDNDGDPDVFIGRTLLPSLYLENRGGRFLDRTADVCEAPLPSLVSSVSAADVDGDGRLDVHFSTYAGNLIEREVSRRDQSGEPELLLADFLSPDESRALTEQLDGWHVYKNKLGPPNVLLRNTPLGFRRDEHAGVEVWRNTYQATWSDYDGDGDPDLYCANDFSINTMLENDGNGRFIDVTERTGTADIGFGMGASFGDYDNDGDEDLYVANMFSKAGQRITEMIPGIDESLKAMARGNTLFRNDGPAFRKVSGLREPALMVEWGGWSWGGQFVDFNNDGYLDIYTLSGYYTAPEDVAIPVDT